MSLTERHCTRAVLLTPDHEVLLMRVTDPGDGWVGWITPGGGAEPGETPLQALQRELHEEVGRTDFEVGPAVWRRSHRFSWEGRPFLQHETFHLVRTDRFEVTALTNPDPLEARSFQAFRWWSLEAIEAAADVVFVPKALGPFLRRLVVEGPPPHVVDVGI